MGKKIWQAEWLNAGDNDSDEKIITAADRVYGFICYLFNVPKPIITPV